MRDVLEALWVGKALAELHGNEEERAKLAAAAAKLEALLNGDRWEPFRIWWDKYGKEMFADGGMLHVKDRGHAAACYDLAWRLWTGED